MLRKLTKLIISGFFIVLPIVLLYMVLAEMVRIIGALVTPFAEMMPIQEISGFYIADILAVLIILIVCILFGVMAMTKFGKSVGNSIENNLLGKIPGYSIIKGLTRSFNTTARNQDFPPVFLVRNGVKEIAFVVDELPSGDCVIFVPLAPTPTIGSVVVAKKEQFQRLEVPFGSVVNSLTLWGIGSGEWIK